MHFTTFPCRTCRLKCLNESHYTAVCHTAVCCTEHHITPRIVISTIQHTMSLSVQSKSTAYMIPCYHITSLLYKLIIHIRSTTQHNTTQHHTTLQYSTPYCMISLTFEEVAVRVRNSRARLANDNTAYGKSIIELSDGKRYRAMPCHLFDVLALPIRHTCETVAQTASQVMSSMIDKQSR